VSQRWALMERVDAPDNDNLNRWRLIQTPWGGIYLHRINTPDRHPTLHDHPWPFVSLIVWGGYKELIGERADGTPDGPITGRRFRGWRRGSIHLMRKTDAHTITHVAPHTWTLLLVGRRKPEPIWGYWDESGFTPWDEHPHGDEFRAAMAAREVRQAMREVDGDQ
jgi:hypothetical protein